MRSHQFALFEGKEQSERQIQVAEKLDGFRSHRQNGSQPQLRQESFEEKQKKRVMVEKTIAIVESIRDSLGKENLMKLTEAVEGTRVNYTRGTKRKKTLMPTRKEEQFKREVERTIKAGATIREIEERKELIERIGPHVLKSERKEEATIFIKKSMDKKLNKVLPKSGFQDVNRDGVEQNIPMKHSRLEKPSRIWLPGWLSKLIAIFYSLAAHSIYIFVPIL